MITRGKRVALLISGRGSNMEAFIAAAQAGTLGAEIALVVSNRPSAIGLQTAQRAGIATQVVDHTQFASREAFDQALASVIDKVQPDLVVLAGFMRILTADFVTHFAGRLMNIHPSLLPRYPGLNTHQRAIDNGDERAGATVHYVTAELDGGPPILQASVPVATHDTAATLAARILPIEHQIYPKAAMLHLQGRLTLEGQCAHLDGVALPMTGVQWESLVEMENT